ncbi:MULTISPECIES: translesion DNA synthesis-associated protein ImuA [unclassified Pseudoalteromonas]|uniref:translesion DNA synthesis-associated protein ImuA n=1 Tax=unclassified Pseudoalteromonas TaxID=194690 RepID=UPI000FFE9605|nr:MULTISPECIES: translesion DNA synthesis-associated protein ImuA [unclassified Pseudoalteromonas]RXF02214.1 translesion DNA synthesis-associated protein ImuA [Pseudoalteromonas sp. PS5]USD27583.1 translesion DNA synthesis-associated protein ImuA [Pseudoalteromonas sp. SCSIO 43201]
MANYLELLERKNLLWRGRGRVCKPEAVSTGFTLLDSALQGGWPKHGVIDIQTAVGIGELRLILPHFTQEKRLKVLINPPGRVQAAAINYLSLDLSEFVILQPKSDSEALWAAEQCLKSGASSAVVLWQDALSIAVVKRLQLAAQSGDSRLFVLHQGQYMSTLPFSLSLVLEAKPCALQVSIKKQRGSFSQHAIKLRNTNYWPELEKQTLPNIDESITMPCGYDQRLTS